MSNNNPNEIVIAKLEHMTDEQFWNNVMNQIKILMAQEYVCTIRDDDTNIIIIQFEHDEHKEYWGVKNPVWMTGEEYDDFEFDKEQKEKDSE